MGELGSPMGEFGSPMRPRVPDRPGSVRNP